MATEGRRPLNSFLLGDTNKGPKDLADAIACKRRGNTGPYEKNERQFLRSVE